MKIDLSKIDLENFTIKEGFVGDKKVFLVNPNHLGAKFTQRNKIFRSSLWDEFGNLVSAGFPKFKNAGEDEENFPMPKNLVNTEAILKLDGSLLCFSKWNNNTIIRTRGTIDAIKTLENGHEINLLKEKYPKLFDFNGYKGHTLPYTILTEWTTPTNQIVIKYPEPELVLVGIVDHERYELATQDFLDSFAKSYGLKRPKRYKFKSIQDLLKTVEGWTLEEGEGICLYSNNGQDIHKIKGKIYLALHAFKSNISLDNLIETFLEYGRPSYNDFKEKLIKNFDFECWTMAQPIVSSICDAFKEVIKIEQGMKDFVDKARLMSFRKQQADLILSSYGNTNRSSFCFKLLDNKALENKDYLKLIYQVMKK